MRNVYLHKPIEQNVGDGEIAIDTDARVLKLTTFRGVSLLPLDFVALEAADEQAASLVYLFQADGVARIAAFNAGAGGHGLDGQPWRVPGLTPTAIGSLAVATAHSALFEVLEPLTITSLRLRVESGAADVVLEIADAAGSTLVSYLEQVAAPGDVTRAVSIALDPGRYMARLSVSAPVTVRTVEGRLPWAGALQAHPMMMEVT